jgi:hypothetical protein
MQMPHTSQHQTPFKQKSDSTFLSHAFNKSRNQYLQPHYLAITNPPLHHHRSIPHPPRTRNPISSKQSIKVLIRTRRKIMRDVIIHIVHGNRCAVRRRIRDFVLRASEAEALATVGVNAYGAGGTGVGSAAGTFYGELPVRVV